MQDAPQESNERKSGLMISRKPGQSVTIKTSDGDIQVRVMDLRPGRAKLRFEAPASVRIWRDDIVIREPAEVAK